VLKSTYLEREVKIDLYRSGWHSRRRPYRLLCVNDGQDLAKMGVTTILSQLKCAPQQDIVTKEKSAGYTRPEAKIPILVVGIYAGPNRIQEYGTVGQADYQQRGARADRYERFVLEELLPYLQKRYHISADPAKRAFAGFSLGGLSAFDLVWRNPHIFGRVGVFSGALWWRSQPFRPTKPDANRIVHDTVERDGYRPGLKFWFQVGTRDETEDRNGNGIIDAIDDTLQLITLLKLKGYTTDDIRYLEVEGGTHDPATWARAFPDFLCWWVGCQ